MSGPNPSPPPSRSGLPRRLVGRDPGEEVGGGSRDARREAGGNGGRLFEVLCAGSG